MKPRNFLFCICISLILIAISEPVESQITPGVLASHEPNESIVYHWFSYVPENMNKTSLNYILIAGQNGNVHSDDYNEIIESHRGFAELLIGTATSLNFVVLTPAIPRRVNSGGAYTISLDRESLLDPADFDQRPDLKVNLMIDELIGMLRADGYNMHDKVFIEGFSAGAMFAQRYVLLHPERVQAIAAGQCGGSLTVPGSNYNGKDMNWPVGINDFQSLVGNEFNLSGYLHVPQFIYIGDQDNHVNNSTVSGDGSDLFTGEQIEFLNDTFGDSDPVRLENQADYINEIGGNVEFKLYPGIGHNYTSEMIDDSFTFFSQFKDPDDDTTDDTEPTAVSGSVGGSGGGGGCFISTVGD